MNEIIFLDHESIRDDQSRRHVRSKATQYSHRSGHRKPKARKATTKKRPSTSSLQDSNPSLSRRGSSISVATTATSATSASTGTRNADGEQGIASPASAGAMAGQGPHMSRLGSFADEPFDCYPVPQQSWFGEALDYMWHFMRRGWSSLQQTRAEQDQAMLWVQRLTMNEPTYFYMNMLSVMGDLVSRQQKDPRLLVWLTSQVVTSINEALSDPVKSLAVGTVLTVGRLALREIVVGDLNAGITFHRPAFARMIVMAGGVDALGLPSLVRSHIAWGDRLMTKKTGITMSEIEPALASDPTFGGSASERDGQDDAKVLDSYLPYRTKKSEMPSERGE